jgi:cytochrome c-type biogenesis protein CcmE
MNWNSAPSSSRWGATAVCLGLVHVTAAVHDGRALAGHAAPSRPAIGRRGPSLEGCCPMKPRHKRLAMAGGVCRGRGRIAAWCSTPSRATWCSSIRRPRSAPRGAGGPHLPPRRAGAGRQRQARRRQRQLRRHRHGQDRAGALRASFPTCSRRARAWWPRASFEGGVFVAREVLAKHDENYMPPEAAEALQEGAPGRRR